MKRCPTCNDFALYDDNIHTCPICDSTLVTYVRNVSSRSSTDSTNWETNNGEPVRSNNTQSTNSEQHGANRATPVFETRSGLRYHYRGIVTEITPRARLHNRLKKWIYALFRGEPYQFGNTSHETVLRIEEFHIGRVSGRKRDLIFYGDVEGRFNVGDDVDIIAKRRGDRYIVTRMYLNETESYVRSGPQIPAGIVAILSLIALVLALYLVGGVVAFIASGALLVLLDKAIGVIIVIAVVWWLFRSFFRR